VCGVCAQEHLPLRSNRLSKKKMLKINNLEHVLIGNVIQLFRDMLERKRTANRGSPLLPRIGPHFQGPPRRGKALRRYFK
jgi:hypothetical protein